MYRAVTKLSFVLILALVFVSSSWAQKVALKTNLPYWATLTPNLGVEFGLSDKSTFEFVGGVNPFEVERDVKWKHWSALAEYRYWFCERFNGHFVGLNAFGGQFNIAGVDLPYSGWDVFKRESRYQGWAYGAGISYGYQWVLSKRWNFEFNVALGYMHFDYDQFECKECGAKTGESKKDYFGPTKFQLSFLYFLK